MYEVTRYVAFDSQEFKTKSECIKHEATLNGLLHLCPKCKGQCKLQGEPITEMVYDPDLTGYSGSMSPCYSSQVTGYTKIDCDVCQDHGYTKQLVQPITKEVIVGYQ